MAKTAIESLSDRDSFETARNVDQVERAAMLFGSSAITEGVRDDLMSETYLLDEVQASVDDVDIATEDSHVDEVISIAVTEASRRAEVLGDGYPFVLKGNTLTYRPSRTLCYEFCLAICLAKTITSNPFTRLPRHFERMTTRTVSAYCGGSGIRFGWPSDAEDDVQLTNDFKLRVDEMRKLAGFHVREWVLKPPEDDDVYAAAIAAGNDAKIDSFVWRPFPDNRPGFMTFVGQCACGRTDVLDGSKWTELSREWLNILFVNTSVVSPIIFYATPFHIATDKQFRFMHRSSGLALDRGRLACMAEATVEAHQAQRAVLGELIQLVIPDFVVP